MWSEYVVEISAYFGDLKYVSSRHCMVALKFTQVRALIIKCAAATIRQLLLHALVHLYHLDFETSYRR